MNAAITFFLLSPGAAGVGFIHAVRPAAGLPVGNPFALEIDVPTALATIPRSYLTSPPAITSALCCSCAGDNRSSPTTL